MPVSASANSQMHHTRRNHAVRASVLASAIAGAMAAVLVAACNDTQQPMSATPRQMSALSPSTVRGSFFCTVHLAPAGTRANPTASCVRNTNSAGAGRVKASDVILGKQTVNVELNLSSPAFDSTTRIFSLNVSITNLLAQPIGTTDGTTTDSNAVRAFFSSGPFASGGSGIVTVANASGVGVFQNDTVPFFQYTPFIPPAATSAIENWQFQFAPGVTGVNFSVEVDADVPAQNSVLRWQVLRQGITSNELNSVWQQNTGDVWAVGLNNTIVHFNGTAWSQPITGLAFAAYTSVFGTASADVWVVGGAGAASHWNGGRWTRTVIPGGANLTGVWGSSTSNYYTCANGGIAYHYNGATWTQIAFPFQVTGNLHGVWGSDASHVWMVGDNGQVLFFNGSFWSKTTAPTTQPLLTVWGTSGTNVFAGGGIGTIVHFNGSSWSNQASGTGHTLSGFGGTGPSDVWAVGASGVTQHYNGSTWSTVARNSGFLITSISSSGASGSALWAVGVSGSFLSVASGKFSVSNQSGLPLRGLFATSATDVWVSTIGTILHFDGTTWTNAYVADDDSMAGVWASGPTNVFTVGPLGDIARFNGASWTTAVVAPPSGATGYHGIFGISPNNIDAVGNGGLVEHWNGSSWSLQTRTGTGNLRAVWGGVTTQNYYAVADDRTAWINPNGAGWRAMGFSPANSKGLMGVFGNAPTNVWVGGDSGVVYRLSSGTTLTVPAATGSLTNFHGTWTTSPTDTYLVGDGGSVLHFDGSNWLPLAVPVSAAFRAIYGTAAQNVYVVGDNGVVLQGLGL
jgi:hypothetical protein